MRERSPGGRARRPLLLALVAGVVLVLVGLTSSALVSVASSHYISANLRSVVARDAALVELFVNSSVRTTDLDADGMTPARAAELGASLSRLVSDDDILRIEIRTPDGLVVASDDPAIVGRSNPPSAPMLSVLRSRDGAASIVDEGRESDATDGLRGDPAVVEEHLPILDEDKTVIAVIAVWRTATDILASMADITREVMLVVLVAGVLLAALLFLVFRAAAARLTRQHDQLMDATRRDPLTGLLNHGTLVGLMADGVEAGRDPAARFAVALVDIDNFRLLNDTHGHEAGDDVLLRVAEIVRVEAERRGCHAARFGPDEFLLVTADPEASDVSDAVAAVQRVREALESVSVQFGDSEPLPITVSAGVAGFPEHASAVTELLAAATVALGEAKSSGGDTIRTHDTSEEDRTTSGSFDVLQGLVIAVDTKDRYTKRHSEDVARYAVFIARRMGLDEETQRTLHLAGLLHDVGKIGIPDNVLRKPSKLTADEYAMFQHHVVLGDAIVRDLPNVDEVRAGIRYHHERWDGKGYVEGLEEEGIPLIGRILAVADAFSAMTTTRPYRKALPLTEALKRLGDAAGTQLQEELVTTFIAGIETDADAPLPGEESPALWKPELWVA